MQTNTAITSFFSAMSLCRVCIWASFADWCLMTLRQTPGVFSGRRTLVSLSKPGSRWDGRTTDVGLSKKPKAKDGAFTARYVGYQMSKQSNIHTNASLLSKVTYDVNRVEISENNKHVTITGPGYKDTFNATWLRHHCQCDQCIYPVTEMRFLDPADLAPLYSVKSARTQDNALLMESHEDSHIVRISLDYLAENSYTKVARENRIKERIPDPPKCQGEIPKVQYSDVMTSDRALWEWLNHMNEEGMCLVRGIPSGIKVTEVARRVCQIQPGAYGDSFSTYKVDDEDDNIGHTTQFLVPHMDQSYQENCPGYMLFLCERFDDCVVGGESILVDAWYEARRMQQLHPEEFKVLATVPVSFYNQTIAMGPVDMRFRCPHFTVDPESGEILYMMISSLAQGPLLVPEEDIEPYYQAYHTFSKMLRDSKSKVELRLKKGEMISINHRRILHGRNEFTLNGGKRMMTLCYLSADDVRSRTQLLANEFNGGKPTKFVFNRSSV